MITRITLVVLFFGLVFWSCEGFIDDTTPPTVSITTAFSGSVYEIVSISVMVNDDSGIEKVELWVDGENTNITDDTEPYKLNWNTTTYEDSSAHVIIVRAYDTNGNTADSQPVTLTIDNSLAIPTAVNITVSYSNNSFIITWTKNSDTDFSSYTLYESESDDQLSGSQIYQTDNQNDTTYSVTGIQPGTTKYYWLTVEDTLGLMSISPPVQGATYLFYANFTNDWLCADCGEGIVILSDTDGNFINMATWTGNASFEIPVPDGLTSIPDKFSVTTITGGETYANLYTNLNIPIGTTWTWGKEYPDEPDWESDPGVVDMYFSNVPEHSGYVLSGAWWSRISSYGTIDDTYDISNWEPSNYYIMLKTLYNGVRYSFLENVAAGEITVALSNLDLTDSTSINLNGNSIGYRTYLYGHPNPGNRYAGRYRLDRGVGDSLTYNSVNVYHPQNIFTDYRTSLYFLEDGSDFWYQSVWGEIPTDFTKLDADFEYVSISPIDFELSTTSTNFDEIRSFWNYSDDYNSCSWNVYGPSDLNAYVLPIIPDEVREIYSFLETELFINTVADLIDHSELNSYYEILELVFELPNLFYDVVNDFRARVKYHQEQNLRHIQNDGSKSKNPYDAELFPGDQMYLQYKNMRDKTIN